VDLPGPDWQKIMSTIVAVIESSVLGRTTAFVYNSWPVLLAKAPVPGKTREQWRPAKELNKELDSCPIIVTDINGGKLLEKDYVLGGLEKFAKNKLFYGVCNDFAWVVTSVVAAKKTKGREGPLLPPGTRVEVYSIVGRQDDKHLFTVVNRKSGSDERDYTTWGDDCFVVDQWYALQTVTSPVKSFVGEHMDPVFLTWLKSTLAQTYLVSLSTGERIQSSPTLKSQASLLAGKYPEL